MIGFIYKIIIEIWSFLMKMFVKSSQVKSSQVKSSQVKSSQVKSSQVKSSQVKSSQLKLNKILVGLALVMGMGVSHTALANNWTTTSNNNCKAYNSNPVPNETATWSGECKDGYVHGQGTL